MPSVSKSLAIKDSHNYSIDTSHGNPKSLAVDYENIYTAKNDRSEKRIKNKLVLKPVHVMSKNMEMKLKNRRTPIQNSSVARKEESKQYQKTPERGLKESRNNSLVVLSSNDQNQSLSRSRPKQRHPKLLEGKERISSILKILASSDETEENPNKSKTFTLIQPL